MQPVTERTGANGLVRALFCAAFLLCGCSSDRSAGGGAQATVHNDWLYHHYHWYDDDFWIWADEHPECCDDDDDLRDELKTWYDGLDPEDQQKVRDRVQDWMDENGVTPAGGQSPADLVAQTASERWAALTPEERRDWMDQRRERVEQRRAAGGQGLSAEQRAALGERADLDPEQRAALQESGRGTSLESDSTRRSSRAISNHPTPRRTGLSAGGTRFHGMRGGGRGGRRR